MGGKQIVVHIAGVAGGITQAKNTRYLCKAAQQNSERRRSSIKPRPMVGIYVLSDKRHLAHASLGESPDFVHDLFDRPRNFGPARIRHHTERAKLIAAFLHSNESGNAAPGNRASLGRSTQASL